MTAFCSHIATGVSVCINKSSTKHELNNSVNDLKLLESKFNEYKESEHDIETKKKNILQFSKQMQTTHELDDIIKDVMSKAKDLVNADRCSLFIADYKNNILWSKFAEKEGGKKIEVDMHSGVVGHVLQTCQSMNIKDCYDEKYAQIFNRAIDHSTGYKTKSCIAVPVVDSNSKPIAVIEVINKLESDENHNKLFFTDTDMGYQTFDPPIQSMTGQVFRGCYPA